MNSIFRIHPYVYHGQWVFDDASRGLDKEAFVSGADTLIDLATANIPNAKDGITILFSDSPFPGHQFSLRWLREEYNGNWYWSNEFKREAWFCPALNLHIDPAPKNLYAQVKAKD